MTKRELIEFYQTCEEHYPETDAFIRKYQQNKDRDPQNDGGYIRKAFNEGMEINAEKGEPNQKWHFLSSYLEVDKKGIGNADYDKKAFIWSKGNEETGVGGMGLKCPELLLWLAEAAGCDVKAAREAAEELCERGDRLLACNKIKSLIPWSEIEEQISDKKK